MIAEAKAAKLWDVDTAVSLWAAGAGSEHYPTTAIPSLMVRADPSQWVTDE